MSLRAFSCGLNPRGILSILGVLLSLPIAALLSSCNGTTSTPAPAPMCGTVPYPSNTGTQTPQPITDSPLVWTFSSEPQLHPMKVSVTTNEPGVSPGLIFIEPFAMSAYAEYGQPGALILDNDGNPVWFYPLNSPNLMINTFRTQQLDGKPVLTFWQGTIATPPTYTNLPGGAAEPGGCYYILDNSYRLITTVQAQHGFNANFHDFLITPTNTALFVSSTTVPMDLTPYGGPANGSIYDLAIQEVDLHTGALLFFWDALDHLSLADSNQPASTATESSDVWDPYHLNSVGLTDDPDEVLVSARNMWTIYRINKRTGNIVWQLGGAHSDFTLESGAEFAWQHDARLLPGNVVSLFDDHCCGGQVVPPGTPPSRGLHLQLDFSAMTASVATEYYHNPNINVPSQGSAQSLDSGNVLVGWGSAPYYSEYQAAGNNVDNPELNTLYAAQMPGNNTSYRTYRNTWIGIPGYPPTIAAKSANDGTQVYASWNGSTETSTWQVFGGSKAGKLSPITTAPKSGFETVISVESGGPYFQAKALDSQGRVIGASAVVKSSP